MFWDANFSVPEFLGWKKNLRAPPCDQHLIIQEVPLELLAVRSRLPVRWLIPELNMRWNWFLYTLGIECQLSWFMTILSLFIIFYHILYYIILYHYLSWSTIVYLYVLMSLMYTYVTSKGKKWANSSSAEASLSQPAAASGPFHNAKKTSRCAVGCLAIWLNGFPWFPMVFRGLVVRCFSLIKHGKSTKKIKKGTPNRSFRAHQPSPSHLADQDSKGIMIQAPSVLFWAVDAGNKVAMLCDEKKKKTHRSLEKLDEIEDIDH